MTRFAHADLSLRYVDDRVARQVIEQRVRDELGGGAEISWVAARYVSGGSKVQTWAPGRPIPSWATHVRCVGVERAYPDTLADDPG